MTSQAIQLAAKLATRPGFDCLHDPNPRTNLIEAYYDPVGYPTQGYGRCMSWKRYSPLTQFAPITQDTALQWLYDDLAKAERDIDRLLAGVELTPPAKAALIDFVFNLGPVALANSTLLRLIKARDFVSAGEQFGRWVYGKKQDGTRVVLPGLVKRRAAEKQLWIEGTV
jgi:lysozyme